MLYIKRLKGKEILVKSEHTRLIEKAIREELESRMPGLMQTADELRTLLQNELIRLASDPSIYEDSSSPRADNGLSVGRNNKNAAQAIAKGASDALITYPQNIRRSWRDFFINWTIGKIPWVGPYLANGIEYGLDWAEGWVLQPAYWIIDGVSDNAIETIPDDAFDIGKGKLTNKDVEGANKLKNFINEHDGAFRKPFAPGYMGPLIYTRY